MIRIEQGPGHAGMLANQVPKAAITELRGLISCGCDKCLSKAIAAALNAWPGAEYVYRQPHRLAVSYSNPALILPLTEKPDDKA